MRIVRVLTRLNIGGPSVHAALLSNRLDPKLFSTVLVVGTPDLSEGDRTSWVAGGPARLIQLSELRPPLRPWLDIPAGWKLTRILWRERPRVLHTHMAKAGFLGRAAGILYNRFGPGREPGQRAILIHTFHGHVLTGYFSGWVSRFFRGIERWLARRTDCLIAVSPAIRDELLAMGIGTPEKWRVVPLGLDLSPLGELTPPEGSATLRCGMVGRLVPIKNPAMFLEAAAKSSGRANGPRLSVTVVGDGPLRAEMEEKARGLGLNGTVTFTGWTDDLPACYGKLDVVCLTSWNEGTPVSLIEAMASARAVVATDVGGVRDLLGPPPSAPAEVPAGTFVAAERGLLVRPGDVEGFCAALEHLAADPALRRRMGTEARMHALKRFGYERLLRDIAELYTELDTQTEKIR